MNAVRKVGVVTGASQGIGKGLVRGFLKHGYRVVANSRSIKSATSTDVRCSPATLRLVGRATRGPSDDAQLTSRPEEPLLRS